MSGIEKLTGTPIDAATAGHFAGTVIGAVAEYDPSALGVAVEALNQDLAPHDLKVVTTSQVKGPIERNPKYLRAERIAHLLQLEDFFNPLLELDSQQAVKLATALVDTESRLPVRQTGDRHYAPPYDGTDESIELIRAKDRAYYRRLLAVKSRDGGCR